MNGVSGNIGDVHMRGSKNIASVSRLMRGSKIIASVSRFVRGGKNI